MIYDLILFGSGKSIFSHSVQRGKFSRIKERRKKAFTAAPAKNDVKKFMGHKKLKSFVCKNFSRFIIYELFNASVWVSLFSHTHTTAFPCVFMRCSSKSHRRRNKEANVNLLSLMAAKICIVRKLITFLPCESTLN